MTCHMSQYPPSPQDPNNLPSYDPYAASGYGAGPAKPGSVTFLAVLSIVIGGIFTLCCGVATVSGLMQLVGVNMMSGPTANMRLSPGLQAFGVFDAVIELALFVTLLFIGIGALSLKPWTRRAAVSWWSALMIVWTLIRLVVQVVWVGPATTELMKQIQQTNPTPGLSAPQMQTFMSAWIWIATALPIVIQLLLPILFLALWRKPAITAAFEGNTPGFTPGPPTPYGS